VIAQRRPLGKRVQRREGALNASRHFLEVGRVLALRPQPRRERRDARRMPSLARLVARVRLPQPAHQGLGGEALAVLPQPKEPRGEQRGQVFAGKVALQQIEEREREPDRRGGERRPSAPLPPGDAGAIERGRQLLRDSAGQRPRRHRDGVGRSSGHQ